MKTPIRLLSTIRVSLLLAAILAATAYGLLFWLRAEANLDLAATPADLTIYGENGDDYLGHRVATGDINGDTIEDLIIGAPRADTPGGEDAGTTYIIYGAGSLPALIDLDVSNADVTILGDDSNDAMGEAVAAGDINGDAFDDVIIGAYQADPAGGSSAGETYVIYGGASLPATIDLNSTSADLTVSGDDPSDQSGIAVAAGDINGDTTDDLIIGAHRAAPLSAGATYVIYGSGSLPASIDLNSTSADLTVFGDDATGHSGGAVGTGDINGDTTDDLIIGAFDADPPGGSDAGATHVIYGSGSLPATIDLATVSADLTVLGDDAGDRSGWTVNAGDIDGDTTDDLIIGAFSADPGGQSEAGETYLIYGGGSLPATIDLNSVSADVTVRGNRADDRSGWAVAAGDIDGDTTDDLIIGADRADGPSGPGKTYVIYGSGALAATIDLIDGMSGLIVVGSRTNYTTGGAVAAGDIDGDTIDDLVIGARLADASGPNNSGETYVIYGGGAQATPKPTSTLTHTPTPTITITLTPTPTITPTPCGFPVATCTPSPTPTKIADGGSLSGVFDVLIHDGTKTNQYFYCKARTDHDTSAVDGSGGEATKSALVCVLDIPGLEDPESVVPVDPNIDLAGPPPPPPYGYAGPAKANGTYCPVGSGGCLDILGNAMAEDTSVSVVCFASLGGQLGPNVIAAVFLSSVKVDPANQSGSVDLYYGQGIDECDGKTPKGSASVAFAINLTRYDAPPYSNVTSADSDGDGCPDAFELDKKRTKKDCGDDPWNPHDSDLDFNASYSIMAEIVRADTCQAGLPWGPPPVGCNGGQPDGTIAAGSYIHCQAYLDHDLGDNSIAGKAFCYIDNPLTTVNIENVPNLINTFAGTPTPQFPEGCVPFVIGGAPEDHCGDGLPGAAPPNPMGDNDGLSAPGIITGVLDKIENRLLLDVCFDGIENPNHGPNIYARIDIDAHTGLGTVDIWFNRPDCTKPGTAPSVDGAAIAIAEQNDANCSFTTSRPDCYDFDGDVCSARQELGADVNIGGQRDPFNKFDHMDFDKDGTINVVSDILQVAKHFGPNPGLGFGDVGPAMKGSVSWAHRSADGNINIPNDILGMAAQFGNNCE